jgi:hypothetical protein
MVPPCAGGRGRLKPAPTATIPPERSRLGTSSSGVAFSRPKFGRSDGLGEFNVLDY